MAGIKSMAGKIPGIRNIWLKTERNQMRDFDGVYAIEFASPEAAADYAESPLHESWRKRWEELRENSLSFQVSNPSAGQGAFSFRGQSRRAAEASHRSRR